MHTKAIKRLSAGFVILGMLFWLTAGLMLHASAEELCSLSLDCHTEDRVFPGMHWKIYHIADRDKDTFLLKNGFEKYSIAIDDTSAATLADTAETFAVYADLDHTIRPVDEKDADANGKLTFDNLTTGVYLVCGDTYKLEGSTYTLSPFIIEFGSGGNQVYDLAATPKYVVRDESVGGFDYSVKKVWANDETQPQNRSAYITAEIYRDGERYETVTLDASNDWTYNWHSETAHQWKVIETYVPAGYIVVYRSNETQFVIVNTFTDDSSTTDIVTTQVTDDHDTDIMTTTSDTAVTDTQTTSVTDDSDSGTTVTSTQTTTGKQRQTTTKTTTRTTTITTKSGTGTGEKLPQTGQLWWPVPALAAGGVILMAIGLRLRPKE